MSRFVEVSPVPEGTTVAKIREVFHAFSLHRVSVNNGKAYLEFEDENDIESLDFTFNDAKVEELGGAEINLLSQDFQFPESSQPSVNQPVEAHSQKQQKQTPSWEASQPEAKVSSNPIFLVVRECDVDQVRDISKEEIQNKIFGKFKTGRVVKWNRDVYVEFFDENEIETLDYHFPKLNVPNLGSNSFIDRVDENFNLELIEDTIRKHEAELQEKDAAKKRQEEMQKKAAHMEQLMRKKAQQEQKEKVAQEQIRRRKEEEDRRERERAQHQEELHREQQRKIEEALARKVQQGTEFIEEKTRQGAQAIKDFTCNNSHKASSNSKSALFWGVVVLTWSIYLIFM